MTGDTEDKGGDKMTKKQIRRALDLAGITSGQKQLLGPDHTWVTIDIAINSTTEVEVRVTEEDGTPDIEVAEQIADKVSEVLGFSYWMMTGHRSILVQKQTPSYCDDFDYCNKASSHHY